MSSVASVQAPAEQLLTSEPCSHARFGQQITGRPTQDDIDAIESPFAATMLESLPPVRARSLREGPMACREGVYTCSASIFLWACVATRIARNALCSILAYVRCTLFPTASPEAEDLLIRLLQFNPNKRINAEEALRHPYVAQFHNPADEPYCDHVITIPINDNTKYAPARAPHGH
eukprot:1178065-Prorocentrum_minimum.AAC.5